MVLHQRLNMPLGIPELDGGEYLIDAMFRLGPTRNNGMAEIPVDWDQINAFAAATGRICEPWEAETLFEMCAGYCAARQSGTDATAIAPVDE